MVCVHVCVCERERERERRGGRDGCSQGQGVRPRLPRQCETNQGSQSHVFTRLVSCTEIRAGTVAREPSRSPEAQRKKREMQ